MEPCGAASHHPRVWANQRRAVALPRPLRSPPARARGGLARVRQPRRGAGVCALAGLRLPTEAEFHRAAYGDPWDARACSPLGRGRSRRRATRQLRLPPLGADARGHAPRGRERVGCPRPRRQWVGMDRDAVRGLCGFRGVHPAGIPATRPISSTASTLSSRAVRGRPPRSLYGRASATGSRRTIRTCSRSSAAPAADRFSELPGNDFLDEAVGLVRQGTRNRSNVDRSLSPPPLPSVLEGMRRWHRRCIYAQPGDHSECCIQTGYVDTNQPIRTSQV